MVGSKRKPGQQQVVLTHNLKRAQITLRLLKIKYKYIPKKKKKKKKNPNKQTYIYDNHLEKELLSPISLKFTY